MRALEAELEVAFHEREDERVYRIKGRRVRFERPVKSARTEQHWRPIKHARRIAKPQDRYAEFMAYGEAEGFHTRLEEQRVQVQASDYERSVAPATSDPE